MSRYVDYKRLRSLSDVRSERVRLNRELKYVRYNLEDDYAGIADYFTLNYWKEALMNRVANLSTASGLFFSGLNFAASMLKKRRKKRAARKQAAPYENCME